jgi:hypothetical protein
VMLVADAFGISQLHISLSAVREDVLRAAGPPPIYTDVYLE